MKRQLQFAFEVKSIHGVTPLSCVGSSIDAISTKMSRTRFGHGRPRNSNNKDEVGSSVDTNLA